MIYEIMTNHYFQKEMGFLDLTILQMIELSDTYIKANRLLAQPDVKPHLIRQIFYISLIVSIKNNEAFKVPLAEVAQLLGVCVSEDNLIGLIKLEFCVLIANNYCVQAVTSLDFLLQILLDEEARSYFSEPHSIIDFCLPTLYFFAIDSQTNGPYRKSSVAIAAVCFHLSRVNG